MRRFLLLPAFLGIFFLETQLLVSWLPMAWLSQIRFRPLAVGDSLSLSFKDP